jgi:DNA (cytosine-5)-methyltransferase 1
MKKKKTTGPSFLAVDFFCGAGGTTRGLIDAGGYVLAGIDSEAGCAKTYEANNKNKFGLQQNPKFLQLDLFRRTRSYSRGQQHLALREIRKLVRAAKTNFPRTPLLFSICAPCQPFTRLSKKGVTKERYQKLVHDRSLLLQCIGFIKEFRPKLVFCENVAAITSSKYGEVWSRFEARLRKLSYRTGADVVDASQYGIPQRRKRSIMIGIRQRRLPKTSKSKIKRIALTIPAKSKYARSITVKQAIGDLPPIKAGERHKHIANHASQGLSADNVKRLSSAMPGATNRYLHNTPYGDLSLKCHKRVNKKLKVRCFNDVYTRMHPDKLAPTITTRCLSVSNGRFGHFDRKQVRGISMREAALLQSFPRGYVFYPKDQLGNAARMIGNAVPPKLARFFARYLLSIAT